MLLEGMAGAFRQSDVSLCFLLGLLSWSDSLARVRADLQPAQASVPPEWPQPEPEVTEATEAGLLLLLGLISFDATLRAACERAARQAPTALQAPHPGFEPLNLGR